MRASRVHTRDQQPDAVGSLAVVLGVGLGAVADAGGDVGEEDGAAVGQARGEGLLFHEVGEDAGVGGQAGESDAVVGVDGDDFTLVGGEFFGVALETWSINEQDSRVKEKAGVLLVRRGRRGFC